VSSWILFGLYGGDLWYALPLIIVVSLVYAATRAEETNQIITHMVRTLIGVVGFMAVIFALLSLMSLFT
jgi:hypothetical protein